MRPIFLIIVVLITIQARCVSIKEIVQLGEIPEITNTAFNLSHKNITSLEGLQDIPGIATVRSLNLSQNQLEELPELFSSEFAHLELLDLSDNKLAYLPEHVFNNLKQLRILYLTRNHLQTLPAHIFSNLTQLEILAFNHNKLCTIPVNLFDKLTQLRELTLTDNCLRTLDAQVFSALHSLKELDISNNQLVSLPNNLFFNLKNLSILGLSNNNLQTLPQDIFKYLNSLMTLDVSNNTIQELPDGIFDTVPLLRDCNISHNPIPLTTQEFQDRYLRDNTVEDRDLAFKTQEQEIGESIQKKCLELVTAFSGAQNQEKLKIITTIRNFSIPEDIVYCVHARDGAGNTPLHKAVILNNIVLVKAIIRKWPQLLVAQNKKGQTPLHLVMTTSNNQERALLFTREILALSSCPEYLLTIQDNNGDTPLHWALYTHKLKLLKYLMALAYSKQEPVTTSQALAPSM